MARGLPVKVMPLYHPLETLALRLANHIDKLADFEYGDGNVSCLRSGLSLA